jgi:hypothetical protein
VVEDGNCGTYYDEPTLYGPIGAAVTSTYYAGTVTMVNGVEVVATYTGAAPGGLLPEGEYDLVRPPKYRTNLDR